MIIQDEWLNDCPERFLHIHTAQYLHLNEVATSRTEGAHWLLKQELQVSTSDLLIVLRSFERVVKARFIKLQYEIESEKIKRPTGIQPLYKLLIGRISMKAIRHTMNFQDRYLPESEDRPAIPPTCNCNSKETAGFPYIHLLKQYRDENRPLKPLLFYQQWHLWSVEAPPINSLLLLQDPLQVRRRGRPQGARNFISQSTT